jgi:hypothetical protein
MIGVQSKRALLVATGLLGEKFGSVKECILQELRPLCFIGFTGRLKGQPNMMTDRQKQKQIPTE